MSEHPQSTEARLDAIVEWIRHYEKVYWRPQCDKQIDFLIDRNLSECLSKNASDESAKG